MNILILYMGAIFIISIAQFKIFSISIYNSTHAFSISLIIELSQKNR